MASSFARGASSGVNTTSGQPADAAAAARARPWLPADAVTSSRAVSPRSRRARTALKAPRALNEFDTWSDSSLRTTRRSARSDSQRDSTSGVRRTNGAIRRRARRTSTSAKELRQLRGERGTRQHLSDAGLAGRVDDVGLYVRGVADGRNLGERWILLHRRDDRERAGARIVQVED